MSRSRILIPENLHHPNREIGLLCHLIISRTATYTTEEQDENGKWAYLNVELRKGVFGEAKIDNREMYLWVVDEAERRRIIEVKNYSPGTRPFGFCLTPKYAAAKPVWRTITGEVARRYNDFKANDWLQQKKAVEGKTRISPRTYDRLRAHLKRITVKCDDASMDWLKNHPATVKATERCYRDTDRILIDKVNEGGEFGVSIAPRAYRFSSWVNRCWTPIRKLILADGEQTVERDVHCSHGAIIVGWCLKKYGEHSDLLLARDLIERGLFWKHLQKLTGCEDMPKGKWKQEYWFGFLFDRWNPVRKTEDGRVFYPQYPLKAVFKEHFPHIYDFLRYMKTECPQDDYPDEERHKHLSLKCLRFESELMLQDVLTNGLWILDGNRFATSVHDSIIVKKTDEDLLVQEMKEGWTRRVGFCPQVKS